MAANFRLLDYPAEMVPFVDMFLDQYKFNDKCHNISPHLLWERICDALLCCKFQQPCEYAKVFELPKDEQRRLIKCLGHRIGVWDLHVYYELRCRLFCKK